MIQLSANDGADLIDFNLFSVFLNQTEKWNLQYLKGT